MDNFDMIMQRWGEVLSSDAELQERNKSIYSGIEGRTVIQLEVEWQPSYIVEVKDGQFKVQEGTADTPLFKWKLSVDLCKDVMLGNHRLIYSLLDPRSSISFDTPNFTHWNGATVIEMLYLACEMCEKNHEVLKLVEALEEGGR